MTLTDLINEYLDVTKDPSTGNRARGIRRMNARHLSITAGQDYFWMEKELSLTSVAGQQVYNLPVGFVKLESTIRYNDGGSDSVTSEIADPITFDEINRQGSTVTSDYPIYHHIRNGQLYLFPVPSSAGKSIKTQYRRRAYKLSKEDVTTGTVSVTAGSKQVTGSSTTFSSSAIKAGMVIEFNSDGIFYEIASVSNNTSLSLVKDYEGSSTSGLSYRIGDAPILPEEFHELIWRGAVIDYYGKKEATTMRLHQEVYLAMLQQLKVYSQSESGTNIFHKRKYIQRTINEFPQNIG